MVHGDSVEHLEIQTNATEQSIVAAQASGEASGQVSYCIRPSAPLQAIKWKMVPEDNKKAIWTSLKSQYKNRQYNLLQKYLKSKDCPDDVAEANWQWLIVNKWETEGFKDQSSRNETNREKQEMKLVVGTKSSCQHAFEMKEKDSPVWPSAAEVWKKTRTKKHGTWAVSNGEEIRLQEEEEKNKEQIASAAIPMVENFGLVLGKKRNYTRGLGFKGMTSATEERTRLLAENEASKKRADDLDVEVVKLNEITQRQNEQIQAQQDALERQDRQVRKLSAALEQLVKSGVLSSTDEEVDA
ncbi:Transposase, Ptta/En/Spm, plant [Corchorus olitorius]|uniref:Transposase, Ptta/En/Spm, plant n=1 Tax=Corchorus olitorius TaxID=93759 RepID=A0A1R3JJ04_9ROSI|nr:Transposase, Ptta/En/Spm, plant [Corchorus olitorius]